MSPERLQGVGRYSRCLESHTTSPRPAQSRGAAEVKALGSPTVSQLSTHPGGLVCISQRPGENPAPTTEATKPHTSLSAFPPPLTRPSPSLLPSGIKNHCPIIYLQTGPAQSSPCSQVLARGPDLRQEEFQEEFKGRTVVVYCQNKQKAR